MKGDQISSTCHSLGGCIRGSEGRSIVRMHVTHLVSTKWVRAAAAKPAKTVFPVSYCGEENTSRDRISVWVPGGIISICNTRREDQPTHVILRLAIPLFLLLPFLHSDSDGASDQGVMAYIKRVQEGSVSDRSMCAIRSRRMRVRVDSLRLPSLSSTFLKAFCSSVSS